MEAIVRELRQFVWGDNVRSADTARAPMRSHVGGGGGRGEGPSVNFTKNGVKRFNFQLNCQFYTIKGLIPFVK